MQVLTGGLMLGAIAFGALAVLHGLANTLDAVALGLHRAASSLRALQDRRTAAITEEWVRTLERVPSPPDAREAARRGRWGS